MRAKNGPTLLLAHPIGVEAGLRALSEDSAGRVDVLTYGATASSVVGPPSGEVFVVPNDERPVAMLRNAAGLIRALRRRRYGLVVVAQPNLSISRGRGPLCAFPFLLSRRVQTMEGVGQPQSLSPVVAAADLVRWAIYQVGAFAVGAVAGTAFQRLSDTAAGPPRPPAQRGSMLYLRTDVDLAIAPLMAGGSLSHTLGILAALERAGFEAELWSTGEIAGAVISPRGRLPSVLRANLPVEIAELLSGLRQALAGWFKPGPAAFVYQRYSLNNLAGLILARRWGVPLILEANCSEVQWRRQWSSLSFGRLASACERLLLRHADRVVVVSENARADIMRAGADADRVRVVPNGVDVERFAGAEPIELDFPEDSFVICFCGLFYRWHGVPTLARAFVELSAQMPEARLLLVGAGDQEALVRSILTDDGVIDLVSMRGLVPKDDVPRYLAASDVVVSPHADVKEFIGSPIKVFEYMASGKPIVASRVAQIAEVLTDEETALIVPPEDPMALASALRRLGSDPQLRDRLGSTAREEARRVHSWDARVRQILTTS